MVERENFPKSVDINPTSKCNLSCSMCWGPNHETPDLLSVGDWKSVIRFFSERGTDAIVFTGGEPLLHRDVPELIQYSKDLGMRITLSTNTILLHTSYNNFLPLIDELGIPMDASSEEKNLQIREGRINSFRFQVAALSSVKKIFPNMEVTVRTVVSKKNIDDISNIGELLKQYKGLFDRWKIYQFSPFSYGKLNRKQHEISYQRFLVSCDELRTRYPDYKIDIQSSSSGEGRYVFVGSQGDVYGVGQGNYLFVDNFLDNSPQELSEKITSVFEPAKNSTHAHAQSED